MQKLPNWVCFTAHLNWNMLGCSNEVECCQVVFLPSWFQWLAQQIRSGPGAGLSIWKKRRPSQLLLNYSKRYFISKSHYNLTSLFSALLGLLIRSVFLWQHQSFPQSRNGFKVGMKLEGLDPCHPSLFCVLSVAEVRMRCTLDSVCSLSRWNDMHAVSLCPLDPGLQGEAPFWWLPRMLRLLGKCWLVGHETSWLVWEERA